MTSMAVLPNTDLMISDAFISPEHITTKIFSLLQQIRPNWSTANMIVQRFENGITNQTYGIFIKNLHSNEIVDESQGLLLKIYGEHTSLFINRQEEINFMKVLSNYELSNRLLILFSNGFVASYIPGQACICRQISSVSIASLIAKQMAKFHSIPSGRNAKEASLLPQIKKLLGTLHSNTTLYSQIVTDLAYIEENVVSKLNLDLVLCHNDLLPANIIYDCTKHTVSFIDFEYAAYNYWLYDIANHFGEYIDYFEHPEIDTYPSRDFRKQWLKVYLSHRDPMICNLIFDLDQLCDLTEILTALSHLFWSLWLFAQIHLPGDKKFDCEKYAYIRFERYLQFRKYLYDKDNDR